jgi:hypothetical protein
MDAEFFCLNAHVEVAGQLVRNLTRYVDPSIALKVQNIDTGYPDRSEIGQRYTKLLHASIPPERELDIQAVTGIELFGFRIYLRIYWPMLVEGYYSYPGVSELVSGPHWISYERQFHGGGRGLERFLPALAIRDRMVLVPKGQNETLDAMGAKVPVPPPLERAVIEVDFNDPAELERAFVTIGTELRRELRHELLAYQSYHLSDESEFDTVSALLGVPPSLLRHALREESDARELIYRQLRCILDPATVVKDVQTRLSLRIDNPSDIDLGRLRVQVRGPSSGLEVNPQRADVELTAGGSAHVDYSVAATRVGEFVIEVLFLDADVDTPREMLPVQQLWITSVAGG